MANAAEAATLALDAGEPILRVARRALSGEVPVVVTRSVYRSDRFTMWVQLAQN